MDFQTKYLKELKDNLEKTAADADMKYYYIAGIIDFIAKENNMMVTPISLPMPTPTPVKPMIPIVHNPFVIPKDNPVIKHDEPKKRLHSGEKENIVKSYKAQALTALVACGKDCYMDTKEIMKYQGIIYSTNNYQKMNIALKQLIEEGKIMRVRKRVGTSCRGVQYEYCLPNHGEARFITNGEISQQQRKV